jgi:hypothetical protein
LAPQVEFTLRMKILGSEKLEKIWHKWGERSRFFSSLLEKKGARLRAQGAREKTNIKQNGEHRTSNIELPTSNDKWKGIGASAGGKIEDGRQMSEDGGQTKSMNIERPTLNAQLRILKMRWRSRFTFFRHIGLRRAGGAREKTETRQTD